MTVTMIHFRFLIVTLHRDVPPMVKSNWFKSCQSKFIPFIFYCTILVILFQRNTLLLCFLNNFPSWLTSAVNFVPSFSFFAFSVNRKRVATEYLSILGMLCQDLRVQYMQVGQLQTLQFIAKSLVLFPLERSGLNNHRDI